MPAFLLLLILIAIIFGGWGVFAFLGSFALLAFFWKVAIGVGILAVVMFVVILTVVSIGAMRQTARDEATHRATREADVARLAARAARLAGSTREAAEAVGGPTSQVPKDRTPV